MGCGWSRIGICMGDGQGNLCRYCREEEEDNERRRTTCHFCHGLCTDENSEHGARASHLSNEHAKCRIEYDEKRFGKNFDAKRPAGFNYSKEQWARELEYGRRHKEHLLEFLGRKKPKAPPPTNVIAVDFKAGRRT